jgi:hypothetical protein
MIGVEKKKKYRLKTSIKTGLTQDLNLRKKFLQSKLCHNKLNKECFFNAMDTLYVYQVLCMIYQQF